MAKRTYTARLDKERVDAMMEMTGLTFTKSLEALIESFIQGAPFNVVNVEKGVYVLTYRAVGHGGVDSAGKK